MMYLDLMKFPVRHENLRWEAGEALLNVNEQPHLFIRIKLTGTKFPHRALISQVWVGRVFAKHVEIDDEGLSVQAYFDRKPRGGNLYFGHLGKAELNFGKFDSGKIALLDRSRLPRNVKMYDWR